MKTILQSDIKSVKSPYLIYLAILMLTLYFPISASSQTDLAFGKPVNGTITQTSEKNAIIFRGIKTI